MTDDAERAGGDVANEITVVLEVHRHEQGGYQVSISALDEKGAGTGYRLHGPKFCGCHESELLVQHTLNIRDAEELRRYAEKVLMPVWESEGRGDVSMQGET